jgi:hypothetical protein
VTVHRKACEALGWDTLLMYRPGNARLDNAHFLAWSEVCDAAQLWSEGGSMQHTVDCFQLLQPLQIPQLLHLLQLC